jgi:putative cell wall-binding protein
MKGHNGIICGVVTFSILIILTSQVYAANPPYFVVIESISSPISSEIGYGQTNNLQVKATSTDVDDINATISILVFNSSGPVTGFSGFDNQSAILYGGGDSHTFTFTYNMNSSLISTGIYTLNISLDADGTFMETQQFNVSVVSQYHPTLEIVYPQIGPNENGKFRALVANNGTTNSSTGRIALDIYRIESGQNVSYNLDDTHTLIRNVTAGSSKYFDFLWTVDTLPNTCSKTGEYNVSSGFSYGGIWSGSPPGWLTTVDTVKLQIDDYYDNDPIGTEVEPNELALGDVIEVQVAVSNRGQVNTTINLVDAWIEDASGNRIDSISLINVSGVAITSCGCSSSPTTGVYLSEWASCSGPVPAKYFLFRGSIPENLSLTKDYKAHIGLDYGVPKDESTVGWNDEFTADFKIVDLNVSGIYVTSEVASNRDASLTISVTNVGSETSTMGQLKAEIKNSTGDVVKNYSMFSVGSISGGETKNFTFSTWNVPSSLGPGNYYVEAQVDFGLSKLRISNQTFEIVQVGVNNVSSFTTAIGESSNVTVQLNNSGPTSATIETISYELIGSSPSVSKNISNIEIPASTLYNYTTEIDIPIGLPSGNYFMNVTFVYGNGKTVTDTSSIFQALPVGIKSYTIPTSAVNGTSLTVNVTLKNTGGSDVPVTLNLTANGTVLLNTTTVTAINNSETSALLTGTLTNGTYTINITANYSGLPTGISRSGSIIVYPTPTAAPELEISTSDIVLSPSSPTAGQNVTINATVHNTGGANATGFLVELLVNGTSLGTNTLSVANGSTSTTQFTWASPTAGSHNITIIVDPTDVVSGENESNNNATRTVTVSSTSTTVTAVSLGGGGPPPLIPISEGINPLTTTVIEDIITSRGLASATYKDAPSTVVASILSSDSYTAPTMTDALSILKRPVERIEGDVYEAAVEAILDRFVFANTVIIARGDLSPDSMAAVAYAKEKHIPILLTESRELPGVTSGAIDRLGPEQIIIVGEDDAVSGDVQAELAGKAPVERIGGGDRYETAVLLAERIDKPQTIVVADGEDPSTDAALVAAIYRAPLVYVTSAGVPEVTRQYLLNNKFTEFYKKPMKVVLVGVEPAVADEITRLMETEKWGATIRVYVENALGEGVYLDLTVDQAARTKWVDGGRKADYGSYDVEVGTHTITIRWLEPETEIWRERSRVVEVGIGETISVTLSTG